jgi:hypothetical protein
MDPGSRPGRRKSVLRGQRNVLPADAGSTESIKFYGNAAGLAGGVFDGFAEREAVLLRAVFEAARHGDTDGEAGDDQDGQDGDGLLHLYARRPAFDFVGGPLLIAIMARLV